MSNIIKMETSSQRVYYVILAIFCTYWHPKVICACVWKKTRPFPSWNSKFSFLDVRVILLALLSGHKKNLWRFTICLTKALWNEQEYRKERRTFFLSDSHPAFFFSQSRRLLTKNFKSAETVKEKFRCLWIRGQGAIKLG